MRPSIAKHDPIKGGWVDGAGTPISGDAPLAQLGVNGQFEHPTDVYPVGHANAGQPRIMTITSIQTLSSGHVVVTAAG